MRLGNFHLDQEKPMVRRLVALVLLFTSMCAVGLAQGIALDPTPPSRAQVLALMTAMGVRQGAENSLKNAQDKVKASAQAAYKKKNPDADEASMKKLDAVFDTTPLFGFEEISETLVGVYQKNLSAADVQAAIEFYNSESGKRLLEKLPVIIRQSNERSKALVQQKLEEYSDEIARKLEAFQQDMEQKKPASVAKPKANDSSSTTDQKSK
jgi:hypothetical protein